MTKPHVLMTLPHMGTTCKATEQAVRQLMQDDRVRLTIEDCTSVPYENNLNQAIKRFKAEEFDYWFNLDSDNAPTRNPFDLIFLDLDVVGCPYPSFKMDKWPAENPFFFSAYEWVPSERAFRPHLNKSGLQEVDAVSSGCMLVARRVLLAVTQPLLRRYDSDGIVTMGCDLSFCTKAKEAGFRVWSHFDYPCRHYKEVDLLQILQIMAEERDG